MRVLYNRVCVHADRHLYEYPIIPLGLDREGGPAAQRIRIVFIATRVRRAHERGSGGAGLHGESMSEAREGGHGMQVHRYGVRAGRRSFRTQAAASIMKSFRR